jgi:FAD/FMN-containing dehydrogenase
VAEAIELARKEELELTVRGGGHNFAGLAVSDDGLMIDLSAMRDVTVDAATTRPAAPGGQRARSSTPRQRRTASR